MNRDGAHPLRKRGPWDSSDCGRPGPGPQASNLTIGPATSTLRDRRHRALQTPLSGSGCPILKDSVSESLGRPRASPLAWPAPPARVTTGSRRALLATHRP